MRKIIKVEQSEIRDRDPDTGMVRLINGETIPARSIQVIAEAAIGPAFVGVPYSGAETEADMPAEVVRPTGERADLPA